MKNTYIKHETTIEELCKNIVAAASAQLQEHGVISLTFICVGPRRTVHWTAQSLSNKSVLAEFVNDCRLLCVAEEATNAMFVAQISIGSEKSPAIKTPGSSTKYGQECLLIQIEAAEGQNESFMVPIIPQVSGKPTLGISRIMLKGLLAGITNELLPKAKPTEAERIVAELALQHNPRLTGYNPFQSN
jgi:hypothetical protein